MVSPCQLLVDVDIGIIRRNIFIGNMDVLPGQPQDFTHTQRADNAVVDIHVGTVVKNIQAAMHIQFQCRRDPLCSGSGCR